MCGIAGIWTSGGIGPDEGRDIVRRMAQTIIHRGPDDEGQFVDPEAGVAFAFRRLSIIDLTPLGHQPMQSVSGRFTLVFNGEIYNHHTLRTELIHSGASFDGRSDTEVLCAGFEIWGVRKTLERAAGMFAIAAWDARDKCLVLARDRIGIKPLYVYADGQRVAFGSELKALHASPGFRTVLDADAMQDYLDLLYVPGPATIWKNVRKLSPGCLLEIRDPSAALPDEQRFWAIEDIARQGRLGGYVLTEKDAAMAVDEALRLVIGEHLQSDVPLGAFLSSGIDSTTVVAVASQVAERPIRTFTIRFDDPVHDESAAAEAIARHLGTEHTTIPLAGDAALDLIPRLPHIYDEPFADPSQVPSLMVAEAARRHVTVVLTGDGGDELFAGYNRYRFGRSLFPWLNRMPGFVRNAMAAMVDLMPAGSIDRGVRMGGTVVPALGRLRLAEEKARKLARLARFFGDERRYLALVSTTRDRARNRAVATIRLPEALETAFARQTANASLLDRMLLADQLGYLPDNQMTKVDRASMAVGLEARVPLLDHRLVELAWRLPESWLLCHGESKRVLRQQVYRYVPRSLLDHPKVGFSVPLAAWLRGPLRPWAESLIGRDALRASPLDGQVVGTARDLLHAGNDDVALECWAYLQFEAWRRCWLP